ncbi:hypothetical protein AHAS_Ahas11G0044900 [Arachis hypogaea]
MCKVEEMLEEPLQSVSYPLKPIISSPTRPLLQYPDATHSCCFDRQVEELIKNYGTAILVRCNFAEDKEDMVFLAVKVLKESKEYMKEFVNEVVIISRTFHALIYEFMSNGFLDKFTYKQGSFHLISNLDWDTLYQITISVGRELDYLHRSCNTRILQLDIKPQNILLDKNFCLKITDVELAKIYKKNESIMPMLGTRWTPGYITREIFSRMYGGVSHKTDM